MPIPYPVSRTVISTTAWGIPVTDEINSLRAWVTANTPTPWTAVTGFTNGWRNYGPPYQLTSYRKVGDIVYLRGLMTAGATGDAFQMPAGFRTTLHEDFSFTPVGAAIPDIITILPTGQVAISAKSGSHIWLTGILYSTIN